ncbi:MAG: FtsL-like putative cell division protein [Vicingaceae bacterium]
MKEEEQDKKEGKSQGTYIVNFLTGNFLSHDRLVSNMPYVFFLTFIAIIYIANGYYAEKTVKQLYRTTNEIKELRSEYISNKSELEIIKQQSNVALSIKALKLKESLTPPNKIIINNNTD